jgi:hypothetical protein
MPTYEKGEMFDSPGVHIVTVSSFINDDGHHANYDTGGRMEQDLVKYGLKILFSVVEGNPAMTYHLNHPGLSLNKISIPEIDDLIGSLPASVRIRQKA